MHTPTHAHTYAHTHTITRLHMNTCTQTHAHACACARAHTHTHIHTHTHTHTVGKEYRSQTTVPTSPCKADEDRSSFSELQRHGSLHTHGQLCEETALRTQTCTHAHVDMLDAKLHVMVDDVRYESHTHTRRYGNSDICTRHAYTNTHMYTHARNFSFSSSLTLSFNGTERSL